MTPAVPAGIVVFCPLGIWIASQSRLNVNSVFSYMALTSSSYYATDEVNDEIRMTNDETMSKDEMTNGTVRFFHLVIPSSFDIRASSFNTHRACNACRS